MERIFDDAPALQQRLDFRISEECPFCGELLYKSDPDHDWWHETIEESIACRVQRNKLEY